MCGSDLRSFGHSPGKKADVGEYCVECAGFSGMLVNNSLTMIELRRRLSLGNTCGGAFQLLR
jgi:hypothetical protein